MTVLDKNNGTTISWLLLLILTASSVILATLLTSKPVLIVTALVIVLLKGQQIIDIFMELRHAPRRWRLLLLSYVMVVPLIISVIYLW